MDINNIYKKIENAFTYMKPTPTANSVLENTIDLQKTFSSDNLNIIPVIKKILNLEDTFPNNILQSSNGHKYNELEFFQSNIDSNIGSKSNVTR